MIRDKYRVEGKVKQRYVKRHSSNDYYVWCEQSADDLRYDVAQGTCEAEDLPEDIKAKCDAYDGYAYACEWPMEGKT